MTVINIGMVSVSGETEGAVYLQNAGYINQGSTPISNLQLKSGMWLLDAPEQTSVDNSYGIGAGKTIDLIKKGNFIYSIGNGAFTVTDAEQKKTLGKIDGFGTLRQMDITADGKHAVITGRQDGVYIINIEDPETPKIIATYNAIEQATGIHVSGDYAFVCNRQYGVEVVDISDPSKPTHLANIHSGEVQSCTVYNNILYAGVWGQCGIYMYDMSKLNDSSDLKPIATVTPDG